VLAILFHFPLEYFDYYCAFLASRFFTVQILSWFTIAFGFSLCSTIAQISPLDHPRGLLLRVERRASLKQEHLHFVSLLPLGGNLHTDIDDARNVPELFHFFGDFKLAVLVKRD